MWTLLLYYAYSRCVEKINKEQIIGLNVVFPFFSLNYNKLLQNFSVILNVL